MALREGLKVQFSDLGFEVSDSILDKCVELCVVHNIDEEDFVETWAAYSVTNLNGAAPTEEALVQFERKELGKKKENVSSSNARQSTTPLTVYKTPKSNKNPPADDLNDIDTTPKGTKGDGSLARLLSNPVSRGTFSPASFSPISTSPSGKYSARTNSGETVLNFLERTPGDWKGKDKIHLSVSPYRDEILSSQCKVMMEPLLEKAAVLNDVIERIGSHLIELNGLQDPSNNRGVSPTEVVCVGRICCDSNDHLNASSVLLEGSQNLCLGHTVSLDLSRLSHYSLFPGQVVAVVGTNPTGRRLHVTKLYHQAVLPPPTFLPRFSGVLEVVIAAGPFTQSDSAQYEPLQDLMTYIMSHRPHVLVLIGPLVDLRQAQLTDGSIAESYDAFTDKIINGVMDKIKGTWTQVVIVSSAHDAACLPIFPTPPPLGVRHFSSPLHMVADPALLNINGLVLGLTATDSLMHLSKEELTFPLGGSDRLGRLASHLLQQQSFYPLYPPCEELTIDSELWDVHASLPVTPHVLVVPSNFRYFIKQLHGCLVVNPEHLIKGTGGGTFARLEIAPPSDDDTWSPASHISAQIVKVRELNEKGCYLPEPIDHGKFRNSQQRCSPSNISSICSLVPGTIVPHEWPLFIDCDQEYRLMPSIAKVTICRNGVWRHMPICVPAINIIPKDEWAENINSNFPEQNLPLKRVIIAHTATHPCNSSADCLILAQSIQQTHKNRFGDIGYNFLVGGGGEVLEGQGWGRLGAHTLGYNTGSVCIALLGDYDKAAASPAMLVAVKKLIELGVATGKLDKQYKLNAHCQLIPIASPGKKVFDEIKSWNNWNSINALRCTQ